MHSHKDGIWEIKKTRFKKRNNVKARYWWLYKQGWSNGDDTAKTNCIIPKCMLETIKKIIIPNNIQKQKMHAKDYLLSIIISYTTTWLNPKRTAWESNQEQE